MARRDEIPRPRDLARARKNGRAAIERGAVHHDGAEGLTRAGRLISIDDLDPQVLATDFFPVGDLAGVNIAELLGREVIDRVIVVHDDRDTVVGNDGWESGPDPVRRH